jgi:hypothetical protein
MRSMSDTIPIEGRDQRGRFQTGTKAGPGRPAGSRNKLGEAFVSDLAEAWQTHGKAALEKTAIEEPATFCRIVSALLPKQAEVDIGVSVFADVANVVEAFRMASDLLGTDPRRGVRRLKQIDHEETDVFTQRR